MPAAESARSAGSIPPVTPPRSRSSRTSASCRREKSRRRRRFLRFCCPAPNDGREFLFCHSERSEESRAGRFRGTGILPVDRHGRDARATCLFAALRMTSMAKDNRAAFLRLLRAAVNDGSLVKLTLGKFRGADSSLQNLFVR